MHYNNLYITTHMIRNMHIKHSYTHINDDFWSIAQRAFSAIYISIYVLFSLCKQSTGSVIANVFIVYVERLSHAHSINII